MQPTEENCDLEGQMEKGEKRHSCTKDEKRGEIEAPDGLLNSWCLPRFSHDLLQPRATNPYFSLHLSIRLLNIDRAPRQWYTLFFS